MKITHAILLTLFTVCLGGSYCFAAPDAPAPAKDKPAAKEAPADAQNAPSIVDNDPVKYTVDWIDKV
ncbi:MAG: hypothetical protein HY922_01305, partial [Elusimicrobia bacterium]|nr:hypothetical protein [Elusimicrobiota bacterium]